MYASALPQKIRVQEDKLSQAQDIIKDFFENKNSSNVIISDEELIEASTKNFVNNEDKVSPEETTRFFIQGVCWFLILIYGYYFVQDISLSMKDYEHNFQEPFATIFLIESIPLNALIIFLAFKANKFNKLA